MKMSYFASHKAFKTPNYSIWDIRASVDTGG